MKSQYKTVLLLVISLMYFSCTTQNQKDSIEINLHDNKSLLSVSDITDSISSIVLEFTSKSVIGRIDQIIKDDSLLFVLDKQQNTLFKFSLKGDYLGKIHNIGRAAGEFLELSTIAVDRNNKVIFLMDNLQRKMLKYQYDGALIEEVANLDYYCRNLCILENGNLLMLNPDYNAYGMDGVWETNRNGEIERAISEVHSKYKFTWLVYPAFSDYENTISYYDIYSNVVYTLAGSVPTPMFSFNLKQLLPLKYLKSEYGVGFGKGTGRYYVNNGIAETNNTFLLKYYSNVTGSSHVLFSKSTKKASILNSCAEEPNQKEHEIYSFDSNTLVRIITPVETNKNPLLELWHVKTDL